MQDGGTFYTHLHRVASVSALRRLLHVLDNFHQPLFESHAVMRENVHYAHFTIFLYFKIAVRKCLESWKKKTEEVVEKKIHVVVFVA